MNNNTPLSSEITDRISAVWDRCDSETQKLIDDLYDYWETANTDLQVFDARLNKNWTDGSNLYVEKDLTEAYNQGYKDGSNHFYGEDCPLKHEPKTQNPTRPLAPNCRGLS